jgi:hypothetical protein
MKRNEVLALDAEFVADMLFCETIAERIEDAVEQAEWVACGESMARAESNYFERYEPHRLDMEREDAMGYT